MSTTDYSTGTTYTLEQFPDPSALIGGLATYPLSYPHPIEVVGQTAGTLPWPQTIQYTGSPISAMVYSPSNPAYDKNSLPPIDVFSGKYNPTATLPQPPAILPPTAIPQTNRSFLPLPWWKIVVIGGLSTMAVGLLIYYIHLHMKH